MLNNQLDNINQFGLAHVGKSAACSSRVIPLQLVDFVGDSLQSGLHTLEIAAHSGAFCEVSSLCCGRVNIWIDGAKVQFLPSERLAAYMASDTAFSPRTPPGTFTSVLPFIFGGVEMLGMISQHRLMSDWLVVYVIVFFQIFEEARRIKHA